uniref:(northern house mosquito) hypothetical protein n=1 Tax=Culex pipiens TaxID=7175 RepID=A0A8D8J404_CULPI
MPLRSGCVATTLANSHWAGGVFSFLTSTKRLTCRLSISDCHLLRGCRDVTYSLRQRVQISSTFCWTSCQLSSRLRGTSETLGSGRRFIGCWMMKCPGVRASQLSGELEMAQSGRELRQASICVRMV